MGNPPDHPKMLTAGTVDRSTRQTILATLDRATPSGNQGDPVPWRCGVGLWTDGRPRWGNRPLTRRNVLVSQDPKCGARFPALRRP